MRQFLFCLFIAFTFHSLLQASSLKDIRAIMFDMEGVLKTQFTPHRGADGILTWMDTHDIPGLILTNEDQYTVSEIREQLEKLGVNVPQKWKLYSAAEAAKDFIDHKLNLTQDSYFYILGESGLKTTIQSCETPYVKVVKSIKEVGESSSLFVVIGTVRSMQDADLQEAKRWAQKGAKVLTTCPDSKSPNSSSSFPNTIASTLSEGNALRVYSTGKPNPVVVSFAIDNLREKLPDLKSSEILFVGDTLETDMRAALEFGMQGALVLSGNTNENDLHSSIIQPDYVFDDVGSILRTMQDIAVLEPSYDAVHQ